MCVCVCVCVRRIWLELVYQNINSVCTMIIISFITENQIMYEKDDNYNKVTAKKMTSVSEMS